MQLARVRGNVVASIKAPGLAAHKLLVLEAVAAADPMGEGNGNGSGNADGNGDGDRASAADGAALFVAIDLAGAGVGEVVLVTRGSAARIGSDSEAVPTDAAVIAIVDSVQLDGSQTFIKR